ncbi:putative expansin/Lol pI [Heracleum sosnowskyi]|uniref:Expansin/Lol pI n=1 Tax=Heracleum sosnowskyi TaxID=360622 RepID=A0AAD8IYV9_9APIA|nr:putative expansin/Lol pI [Heracleum sosnowskyi]KAK1393311.1 putative expansin/Lol pI [Heracleum sosnowskyi]
MDGFYRLSLPQLLCFQLLLLALYSFTISATSIDRLWRPAVASWYGSPEGDGSTGGACGYGPMVETEPLMKGRVGAASPILFKGGAGCGACYKVKCLDKSICSRKGVRVIITDECPGCPALTQFDLSGAAFGTLAVPGERDQLRNRGIIPIIFRRASCFYPGKNVAFRVNEGSSPYWISLLVEFEGGDGDIGSMHIKEAGSNQWLEMTHSWGANWIMNGGPLKGPFSVKLTTLSSAKTHLAVDVIPKDWRTMDTYISRHNYFV